MVPLSPTLLTLLAAITVVRAADGLAKGEYFRPTGNKVSGRVNATTPYVRSPCPALNTLANHGYLPRDGKNVSNATLSAALRDLYNIGDDVIHLLVDRVPEGVSLSDLSRHNFIEHDASLVHADACDGTDPAVVDPLLWASLASQVKDGQLGTRQFAAVRRDRVTRCHAKPTGCEYTTKARILALGESALLMRGLGGQNAESISLEFAKSFLVDERIPTGYERPATPVSLAGALVTAGNIQLVAFFQDIVALVFP